MIYIGIVLIVVVNEPPQSDQEEVPPEAARSEPEVADGSGDGYKAYCKVCGWSKAYPSVIRAKQALGAHKRFCKGRKWNISPFSRPP